MLKCLIKVNPVGWAAALPGQDIDFWSAWTAAAPRRSGALWTRRGGGEFIWAKGIWSGRCRMRSVGRNAMRLEERQRHITQQSIKINNFCSGSTAKKVKRKMVQPPPGLHMCHSRPKSRNAEKCIRQILHPKNAAQRLQKARTRVCLRL